ncbi:MAG TPA: hypothetical protein EYM68_07205, partial [Gammaproteobacteria bacterium]|nr:hypothetical protein [Gammaproteobacteria bacterium]
MPSSGSHPKPFGACVKSVVTNWAGVIIMPTESRRMGGRAGRHLLRNTPVPVDERPVKPGQRGGRYQPLTEIEIQQIHHAVLDVLAEIGLANAIPSCIERVVGAGGKLSSEGRLLFPRALIEDIIAGAAKDIVLHGQDPRHDLLLSDGRFYFGTAGAAVHMVDLETRTYRDSTLADLYNAARIVDAMEHIH